MSRRVPDTTVVCCVCRRLVCNCDPPSIVPRTPPRVRFNLPSRATFGFMPIPAAPRLTPTVPSPFTPPPLALPPRQPSPPQPRFQLRGATGDTPARRTGILRGQPFLRELTPDRQQRAAAAAAAEARERARLEHLLGMPTQPRPPDPFAGMTLAQRVRAARERAQREEEAAERNARAQQRRRRRSPPPPPPASRKKITRKISKKKPKAQSKARRKVSRKKTTRRKK